MPAYIADVLDRRQGELDGAFAAWRQKPFDAEPHGGRVAGERKLDGLRVKASDSTASNAAAVSVASFRESVRRPAGLPDRAFSNGRPRTCPGSFGTAHQTWSSPWFNRWRIRGAAVDKWNAI
jgi:hypothetical protein